MSRNWLLLYKSRIVIISSIYYYWIIIEEYFLQETRFLVINTILSYLLILIPVLLNVAFITLLERKILAFSQLRVGPNKVA